MTLQALAQIGGVIGVIASLIYVAIQIRNNARAVRASAYQQLAANTSTHWSVLAQNGDLTDIVLRGTDDFHTLSRLEKARFRFNTMANLRQYENAWFQHNIGTLKEDDWVAIAADMDSFFSNPGARTVWPLVQNRSNAKFRAHVTAIVERYAASAGQPTEGKAATVSS